MQEPSGHPGHGGGRRVRGGRGAGRRGPPAATRPARSSPASCSRSAARASCWSPPTRTGWRCASWSPPPTARRRRSCPSARCPRPVARPRRTRRATVEIFVDERQVSFKIGALTLTSRLIEGEFPNYRQLLPEAHESRLDGLAPAAARCRAPRRAAGSRHHAGPAGVQRARRQALVQLARTSVRRSRPSRLATRART